MYYIRYYSSLTRDIIFHKIRLFHSPLSVKRTDYEEPLEEES